MTTKQTVDRLAAQYERHVIRNEDGCWNWLGGDPNHYPRLSLGHTGYVYAHRYSVETAIGHPIADDAWVLHHCDNKRCTRPDHLYVGDQFDNGRDIRERWTLRKTRCRRGHEFTEANTYWHRRVSPKNGREYDARICRTCQRLRGAK